MKVSFVATVFACLLSSGPVCACQRESSSAREAPTQSSEEQVPRPEERCETYGTPRAVGTLPSVVNEASGLVISSFDDQVLWLHNDSGDRARIYAVHSDGTLLATVELAGVEAFDWEDMARGPCEPAGDSSCLYIGDVGDNYRERANVWIHRIREPDPAGGDKVVAEVESMPVTYPDGAHDCEAMVVDENAAVYLLTKELSGTFELFTTQFTNQRSEVVLDHVCTEAAPPGGPWLVTGADYSTADRRLLVRTYTSAVEYRLGEGQTLSDLMGSERMTVPAVLERQGESIGYGTAGYWHVSEGIGPPIHFVPCGDDN